MILAEFLNANYLISFLADVIGNIAVIVVIIGIVEGLILLVKNLFKPQPGQFDCIRLVVGQYLLLGLEFLIGKDILETVIDPTLAELGQLAALIGIRVLINYFLVLDVEGKEKYMRKFTKHAKK